MDNTFARLLLAEDQEAAMREDMAAAIAASHAGVGLARSPLRLLLVGYGGAGNIGADIRILETARQLRAIFGKDAIALGMISRGGSTAPVDGVVVELSDRYFPDFLADTISRYDAVLVCEGSLFKSNFSNTLATMLAGALGIAAAQGKPAIAYGVEAGAMDEPLADFVKAHCARSTVFCRSQGSLDIVRNDLGFDATLGADTAWTFEAAPPDAARRLLSDAGWNAADPILALCPINPFWWPVKPDVMRALTGDDAGEGAHYNTIFYHHHSDDADAKFARYIAAMAEAAAAYARATGAFPVVIGMERLDRTACSLLSAALPGHPPVFTSETLDARHIAGLLRQASLVISSRYHAVVLAMSGKVPTIGITMDERLRNLMAEYGRPDLSIDVDTPDLGHCLAEALQAVIGAGETTRGELDRFVGRQLVRQGRMGQRLAAVIADAYPEYRPAQRAERKLEEFLPTLPTDLRELFDKALRTP